MKGNLDKTKEERDSLQMVVSLLSKELYFRPDKVVKPQTKNTCHQIVSGTVWIVN